MFMIFAFRRWQMTDLLSRVRAAYPKAAVAAVDGKIRLVMGRAVVTLAPAEWAKLLRQAEAARPGR